MCGCILCRALVHEFDIVQALFKFILQSVDFLDLQAILRIIMDGRAHERNNDLFDIGLKCHVVRLMLLIVGPAALLHDPLVTLPVDHVFEGERGIGRQLFVDLDDLLLVVGLLDSAVIPLLVIGASDFLALM